MPSDLNGRAWMAIAVALISAAIVLALTRTWEAAVVAVVGVIVAALVVLAGAERPVAAAAAPSPSPPVEPPIDAVLDAFDEPVLLLRDGRIALANEAALALIGRHIAGEDARTAIRHPAAADLLARPAEEGGSVALAGLGTRDQRWEMHVAPLPHGRRLVHLVDRSGSHAAERMRVDFVANASHELRTPLASILGYVETLAEGAGDEPETRARFLRIVFDEARRMERLVEDLMSLSRIEADKFRRPAEHLDLVALIRQVHAALADTHDGRGRDIALDLPAGRLDVTGDAAQLSQLLHNVIGNAMKYGRAGTPILVRAERAGEEVRLSVTDEGDGIAPEHLPRLTERFYRADAGRSRALGGTGLGLAIVKHIAERHRARLDITSRVGEGTRVAVTFPAVGPLS